MLSFRKLFLEEERQRQRGEYFWAPSIFSMFYTSHASGNLFFPVTCFLYLKAAGSHHSDPEMIDLDHAFIFLEKNMHTS